LAGRGNRSHLKPAYCRTACVHFIPFHSDEDLDPFTPSRYRWRDIQATDTSPGDRLGKDETKGLHWRVDHGRPGSNNRERRVLQPRDMFETAMLPVRIPNLELNSNGIAGLEEKAYKQNVKLQGPSSREFQNGKQLCVGAFFH